jgi:NADH-quinone oxidoreductase subunit J
MPIVDLVYLSCFIAAVAFALGMVILRNPVHCAMCLIGVMVSLASIFVVMHQFFIAAIQIIVYVGAVMALFLWVIMMLNLKEDEKPLRALRDVRGWGAFFGVMLFAILGAAIIMTSFGAPHIELANAPEVALVSIAEGVLLKFLLPVELTSLLLLVAMIGAIVLARPLKGQSEI